MITVTFTCNYLLSLCNLKLTVASPPKQHPVCDLVTAGVCSPMNTFKVTPQADLGQSRVQEPLIPGPHVSVWK